MKPPLSQVSLAQYTTFRIGGPATFFVLVSSVDELKDAVIFAQEKELPLFVLGEGSNLLVSDAGFAGVVIKMEIRGVTFNDKGNERVEVVMGAGEHWDTVVALSAARDLSGFENLSGIPGAAGAAPVQNIGAYGCEIGEVLSWVEVFDTQLMSSRVLQVNECALSYRDSIFKKEPGRFIVTRVACELTRGASPRSSYKDVKEFFIQNNVATPTIRDVREAVLAIRKAKLPDISEYGTAGSFFKNPVVSVEDFKKIQNTFPEIPSFDMPTGEKKIPVAWILDTVCKLKGVRRGNVGLYKNQPLVIVNFDNARAADVMALAEEMRACVATHARIKLTPEVVLLGF